MSERLEALLEALEAGRVEPCILVSGDRVVAEPAAVRIGEALGRRFDCQPTIHRRPARILPLLDDLRTFSLFDPAKVVVAIETAVVADLTAAAGLIDQAIEAPAVDPDQDEPSGSQRTAAIQLLRAIRLFGLDPYAGDPGRLLGELPDWAFQGEKSLRKKSGGRARTKKRIAALREQLAGLLEAARTAGLEGRGEDAADAIAGILDSGLPEGHALVLAENSVVAEHPLVAALSERGALIELGRVEAGKRGWEGLDALTGELARETGVEIDSGAVAELARRTLRHEGGRGAKGVDADSTGRFAAEYRKLAELAGDRINASLVESVVEDRGEEDVWKILDEIGAGQAAAATRRLRRLLASADDPIAARLSFFGLLAGYCRHLAAIGGILERGRVPAGERNYGRFKSRIAPAMQKDPPVGRSPLAGLHPYRLHRAYLAASRMPAGRLAALPARVLETELRLKGESASPDTALELLVADLAAR